MQADKLSFTKMKVNDTVNFELKEAVHYVGQAMVVIREMARGIKVKTFLINGVRILNITIFELERAQSALKFAQKFAT